MSKIKLLNVRLSFPNLFTARAFDEGSKPKFDASFLISPTDSTVDIDGKKYKGKEALKTLKRAMIDAAAERYGTKDKIPNSIKYCLHNGSDKDYDGYPGNYFIPASESRRPLLINRDKTALAESDGVLYDGCYVNAIIDLWVQDNKFGKRVNANLKAVQFYRDGEPRGTGSTVDADEFDDLDEDADPFGDDNASTDADDADDELF